MAWKLRGMVITLGVLLYQRIEALLIGYKQGKGEMPLWQLREGLFRPGTVLFLVLVGGILLLLVGGGLFLSARRESPSRLEGCSVSVREEVGETDGPETNVR